MRTLCVVLAWFLALAVGLSPAAADGNRLVYLDESDPYYVSRSFPKLVTPQWVGQEGVEAVVVLAIDDMRGHEKWEAYLRPILERLKQIDGRAPVSIMTCQIDPREPHLERWLGEGLSLETHTFDHPCPLLGKADLAQAKETFDRCVDLMNQVPGNRPVAFRVPCCDSLNTASPRFYAEVFNKTTPGGNFLSIDSSVFNVFTSNDPELARELVSEPDGRERFGKYVPSDRLFVNTIEDYPYPYVIGRLCWEFPCVAPSDWEAQHLHQPNNPQTVRDLEAALDATVAKQGTFNLVFHPHGWMRSDQVIRLVEHAANQHGNKVKFLTFREAQARLDEHLLGGQPLRAANGMDNGVRLLDLNQDGYLDVVVGNERVRQTRLWSPGARDWMTTGFPIQLVEVDAAGSRHDAGGRFGIVGPAGRVTLLVRNEKTAGAWYFDGAQWVADDGLLQGLQIDGQPVLTQRAGLDLGARLRDLDRDQGCEFVLGNDRQQAVFHWDENERSWQRLPFSLPPATALVDAAGRDAGLRFIDIDEDLDEDVVFSSEEAWSLHLFRSMREGWSREVLAGRRGDEGAIPPITVAGTNNGAWFHSRHLWVQNETTDRLPDLVDRRSLADLLNDVEPEAKTAEASLRSLVPRPGFQVELVAAEPLVMDPVAFAWGPDGRLWVVEMADYPLGLDGQGKLGGRVRYLEDTDDDGRYDRSTVFLDGLGYPSGVMPWRNGVLVTCAPEILYAQDTDGDGRADLRRALFVGFGEGNQQHRVNGLRWGLDNWVYCANGDSGGEIESTQTGEKVALGGRDFRIRPDQGLIDPETGQTQFLRERDDWGNWFGSNNSNPMFHFVLADHYLRRNPHVAAPDARVHVSVAPGAAPVFPISRTLPRFNDQNAANRFTSASSSIIYRDELFGPAFEANSFVCEPVHNLVHREIVAAAGVTFTSRRAPGEERSEFLASSDNWFRPTMVRTGPDGALWVADMYRYVIEHPEWIPQQWQQRLDLRAGHDKGRIYRVFPVGKRPRPIPRLDRLDSAGLVAALDSPSGWQRDMVQQLLVHRQDRAAVPLLAELASDQNRRPTCRLHALCTLDGLAALEPAVLLAALADPHPGVRRHAVRLSEPLSDTSPELADAVEKLVDDQDPQVRLQVAYSLGEWHDPRSGRALGRLALAVADDPYTSAAVLSSVTDHNLSGVVAAVLAQRDASDGVQEPPPPVLVERLAGLAAACHDDDALARLLDAITRPADGKYHLWQLAALGGFLDTIERRNLSLAEFDNRAHGELRAALDGLPNLFAAARSIVADQEADESRRQAALGLLGRGPDQREADLAALGGLLAPQTSGTLQAAAAAALGRLDDPRVAGVLLAGWKGYGPELRGQVLDVLLSRRTWVDALLEQIAAGEVLAAELDAARLQRLLDEADEAVRRRAEQLLAGSVSTDRQQVVERYGAALRLDTDAAADAAAGAEVFKKNCSSCHRLGDVGHPVGPDLTALTDKSPESMLIAVFDPNRAVEAKYLSYTAVTTTGVTHTGMLAVETGNSITLVAPEAKETVLLRVDLEVLAGSTKSFMPEGVEKDLSLQNVADLLAYLGGIKPPRKHFAGNQPAVVRPEALRGEFWLLAANAEIYGSTLVFEERYGNLGYWSSADDHAVWSVDVERPGKYAVSLDYACADDTAGNTFLLEVAGNRLGGRVAGTGNWDTYRQVKIGDVLLAAGPHQLLFRPDGKPAGAMIDLKAIRLRPFEPD